MDDVNLFGDFLVFSPILSLPPNNYTCCLESEKLWNGLWLASFSPRGFTDDLFSLFHIKTPKEGMLKSIDFPHTHTYSVHPYLNILIL